MPEYEYECEVEGPWGGLVTAKNQKEAIEKAKEDVESEGLVVKGGMRLYRVPKEKKS